MKKLLVVAMLCAVAACGTPTPTANVSAGAATPVANTGSFTQMLNSFRASQGAGAMRPNAALNRAAQAHAQDMLARDYFSHRAPNGPNGETFGERANAAGCAMQAGSENIAWGQKSEAEVLQGWQNSPGHRRNLLGASYREYGLGRAGDIWVMKLASAC